MRFDAAAGTVLRMFDDTFARTWRLYWPARGRLSPPAALQLFQLVLPRPGLNEIPWTLVRLYENG